MGCLKQMCVWQCISEPHDENKNADNDANNLGDPDHAPAPSALHVSECVCTAGGSRLHPFGRVYRQRPTNHRQKPPTNQPTNHPPTHPPNQPTDQSTKHQYVVVVQQTNAYCTHNITTKRRHVSVTPPEDAIDGLAHRAKTAAPEEVTRRYFPLPRIDLMLTASPYTIGPCNHNETKTVESHPGTPDGVVRWCESNNGNY